MDWLSNGFWAHIGEFFGEIAIGVGLLALIVLVLFVFALIQAMKGRGNF